MVNDAINILVQKLIEKNLIKKEKGKTLNLLGIILSVKILLGIY